MIMFRHHRGGLRRSMLTVRSFDSMDELFAYLADYYNDLYPGLHFNVSNFRLGHVAGYDDRTGWLDTTLVLVLYPGDPCWYPCGYCATRFLESEDKP